MFWELPKFLSAGDLLVLNNTRVLPWRLVGRRQTGGRVEVLILAREGEQARGYVHPARKLRVGERVPLEGGALWLEVLGHEQAGILRFRLGVDPSVQATLDATLDAVGRAPLPPYIERPESAHPGQRVADRASYQTLFAEVPGAVAAPTAGLHFTERVFEGLAEQGVAVAKVTLHVGPGTFSPVRVAAVEQHAMHAEHYELPAEVAQQVAVTRAAGGRVVAVGTTSARTLEACADRDRGDRTVRPSAGTTDLFLYPGKAFHVVDALLTNFHLPESTLLMLVAAFMGRKEVLSVYEEAIERGYRFYSYGDAMLIL